MKELELYIHIPFCMKKCNYCDFLSAPADEKSQSAYMEALNREIAFWGEQQKSAKVCTIYIGGGTPSWLQDFYITALMEQVHKSFSVSENAEISIECNPGTLTAGKLKAYRKTGINRLSIGLQSADNEELQMLGRVHTYEQFLRNYELAREEGFENINVDLMYSLPLQTVDKFYQTLNQIIYLKPEHISAYSLIIEPGTPFYDKYKFDAVKQDAGMEPFELPNEDCVYQITKMTQELLKKNGYEQYEISNYAKRGFRCRHNVGYWKRKEYLGLGLGAASLLDNIRYSNLSDLYQYIEETQQIHFTGRMNQTNAKGDGMQRKTNLHSTADILTEKNQMEEFLFLGLRMMEGVWKNEFYKTFGFTLDQIYGPVIARLQREELVVSDVERMYLTDKGNDLSNYVLAQFLFD